MNPRIISAATVLDARVAVITGASGGIGAATARLLAARGAKVALLGRRKSLLDQQVAEISAAGGSAIAIAVDLTDQKAVDDAAKAVAAEFGIVNLVVNNAGIMLPAPVAEKRVADWEHMISLNLMAAMRVIGSFVPSLLEAAADGCPSDLVNVSSIAAQNIYPNYAVYSATRAATSHLSRHLRVELGAKDVRVCVVEPGAVGTGDGLEAEDVAGTIAFAVGLPKHINLQQITIMPTRQAT